MIDALGLTRGQQNDPSGQMIQPPRSPPTGDYNTRLGSSSSRPITGQLPRAEETSDDEKAELVVGHLITIKLNLENKLNYLVVTGPSNYPIFYIRIALTFTKQN